MKGLLLFKLKTKLRASPQPRAPGSQAGAAAGQRLFEAAKVGMQHLQSEVAEMTSRKAGGGWWRAGTLRRRAAAAASSSSGGGAASEAWAAGSSSGGAASVALTAEPSDEGTPGGAGGEPQLQALLETLAEGEAGVDQVGGAIEGA
jgi:hypothetical protein